MARLRVFEDCDFEVSNSKKKLFWKCMCGDLLHGTRKSVPHPGSTVWKRQLSGKRRRTIRQIALFKTSCPCSMIIPSKCVDFGTVRFVVSCMEDCFIFQPATAVDSNRIVSTWHKLYLRFAEWNSSNNFCLESSSLALVRKRTEN